MSLCVILAVTSQSIEIESALNFCRISSPLRLKDLSLCNTCNASRISLTLGQTGFSRASSSSSSPLSASSPFSLFNSVINSSSVSKGTVQTTFSSAETTSSAVVPGGKIHQVFRSDFEDL